MPKVKYYILQSKFLKQELLLLSPKQMWLIDHLSEKISFCDSLNETSEFFSSSSGRGHQSKWNLFVISLLQASDSF